MQIFRALSAASLFLIGVSTAAMAGASLSPPPGYELNQMTFEDKFDASTINTSKWNPWLGDAQWGRWGNNGKLASPYSGVNCDGTTGCNNAFQNMYYDPYPYGHTSNTSGNRLVGGNGKMSIIASPSNYFGSQGYTWGSAAVSTYGKVELPREGGFVQFHAKMPDSRYGAWACLWFLSNGGAEIDVQESGYTRGTANPNNVLAMNWHGGGNQIVVDTGMDLAADYHTYGMEYRPGQSIKMYLDGQLKATYTQSIPTNATYQLLIDVEVANNNTNGWHTLSNTQQNPGPFQLDVDNVQVYSLAITPVKPPQNDTTAPTVPSNLVGNTSTQGQVNLAWNASTDAVGVTGYKIVRDGTQLGTSTATSYSDKSIASGTTYTYQVRAYDAAGNNSQATSVSVTTPNTPPVTGWAVDASVATSATSSVMSRPGRGATKCLMPSGSNATILAGPENVGGDWWWVEFETGCSGWVLQSNLVLN